jgi:hypothetical protein
MSASMNRLRRNEVRQATLRPFEFDIASELALMPDFRQHDWHRCSVEVTMAQFFRAWAAKNGADMASILEYLKAG